ncbi:MAG: YvcK family protein [Desulfobulbaceae bacterium]|nr:YvcK family protein [Desulfobulbaceae bacterium]
MVTIKDEQLAECLQRLNSVCFSPFELLNSRNLPEKLIELVLQGAPDGPPWITSGLKSLAASMISKESAQVKVVVFGGGTGLSTIIGGDSRSLSWVEHPFHGLKEVFPHTTAIVCVTDDGGSTGELLKDLPLIGLGDIRHVMLSAIQKVRLREEYGLSDAEASQAGAALFALFNHRFVKAPQSFDELLTRGQLNLRGLPEIMLDGIKRLLRRLFDDRRLVVVMQRPHCLGNLLIASAIYAGVEDGALEASPQAIRDGLREVASLIGVAPDGVLPCTCTPSVLKMHYTNGVMVTGEDKSSAARRGVPIDQVLVDFSEAQPQILTEVVDSIGQADIILFAPGSLYTSIAPIMQVPGLAQAVRANTKAMKLLVGNLWVQAGETDLAIDDPGRRFYASDLITAYHRNIPGGVHGLFNQILLLAMQEIPGNILQSYAIEGKSPIYLDRVKVWNMGFLPIEAAIFSREGLRDRKVRHDPASFATAVKVLWAAKDHLEEKGRHGTKALPPPAVTVPRVGESAEVPSRRYARMRAMLSMIDTIDFERIMDILWRHADIPVEHLGHVRGITTVSRGDWVRGQAWDNLYSFYDPADGRIKIRQDLLGDRRFEVAFLVALGQSLLGDYALRKEVVPLCHEGEGLGKIYHLTLRPESGRRCYFTEAELVRYLSLARMCRSARNPSHFTRVVNGEEGFTPPGLLFGLTYAWYLDNRFASHIEYKMAIGRTAVSDLVPEQMKSQAQRQELIQFFREVVFRQKR